VEGRLGICMFNQECNRKKGQVLGTCLDGFIFGACCDFKEAEEGQDVEDQVKILQTFYAIIFCMKVFFEAFL